MKKVFLYIALVMFMGVAGIQAQTLTKDAVLVGGDGDRITLGAPALVTPNKILLPGTLGLQGAILYISSVASTTGTTTWLNPGTNGHVLTLVAGIPTWSATPSLDFWSLTGNGHTVTDNTNNLLGTTTAAPLRLITGGASNTRVLISATGDVLVNGTAGTPNVRTTSLTNASAGSTGGVMFADASGYLNRLAAPAGTGLLRSTSGGALSWFTPFASIGLSMPSIFSVSGSPLTADGTLSVSLTTQSANTVFAGPASGPDASPTFRALVAADISGIGWTLTGNGHVVTDNTNNLLGTTTAAPLRLITGGAANTRIHITATGDVGIGTTPTASRLLHVNGTSGTTNVRLTSLASTTGTAFSLANDGIVVADAATGDLKRYPASTVVGSLGWTILGNTGTTAGTNFLGTTDAQDLVFKTNGAENMRILQNGRIGVGTSTPTTFINFQRLAPTNESDDNVRITSYGGFNPVYESATARGTIVAPTRLLAGDLIGSFEGLAWDGSAFSDVLRMVGRVPKNHSASSIATQLMFQTTMLTGIRTQFVLDTNGFTGFGHDFLTPSQRIDVRNGDILLSSSADTNRAGRIRFEEAGALAGDHYVSLEAPNLAATNNYILPDAYPTTTGQYLTSTTGGTMSWSPSSATNWLLAGNTLGSASWNGTTGNRLGTNSADALVLATTNATPQNILFYTGVSGANERMRINGTDGRVGINETAPESQLHVVSNSVDNGNDLIVEGFNNGDATDGAEVRTRRGRGTFNAPANVQDGDDLGGFKFEGYFQGAFREAAQIDINIVDPPVNDADDNLRVEMGFNLDDGDGNKNRIMTLVPTERVGIGQNDPSQRLEVRNGNVLLSNSGTAAQLRFQEPNGGGTSYSAFQAGAQSADFVYTLPTTIPTANQVLTASSVSAPNVTLTWASASPILFSRRTADLSITNDVTLNNDAQLVVAVAANTVYEFEAIVAYDGNTVTTSDLQVAFTIPAAATMRW